MITKFVGVHVLDRVMGNDRTLEASQCWGLKRILVPGGYWEHR